MWRPKDIRLSLLVPESERPEFQEEFRRETRELLVNRLRLSLYVGIVVYGAFWLLDLWTTSVSPPETSQLGGISPSLIPYLMLAIRLFVISWAACTIAATHYPWGRKNILPLSVAIVAMGAIGISAMTTLLGGFRSDYFIGNLLVLFLVGFYIPWKPRVTFATCLVVCLSYYIPNLLIYGPSPDMANNGFFLLGTCVFTVSATMAQENSRMRDLAMRGKLELANQEMRRLDEAKTRFFANVSHELRTPLMLILGPLEAILQGREKGDLKPLLTAMNSNGHRLLRQVNQILNYAKVEAGRLELEAQPGNFGNILQELVDSARPYAKEHQMELVDEGLDSIPDSSFDGEKMETVAANLISNAMKFTPDGGRVAVRAGVGEGCFWFEVADSGIGIPQDQLDKVFERFHQVEGGTTGKSQGTGLGLPLSKEIVLLHGGEIKVSSEPGEGACFRVTMPLSKKSAVATTEAEASSQQPAEAPLQRRNSTQTMFADLKSENLDEAELPEAPEDAAQLLVVEDNSDLRNFLIRSFSSQFKVASAPDGLQGYQAALRVLPDLVISDVMMPGIDGFELLGRLRKNPSTSNIPVILLTARAGVEEVIRGLNTGAVDYVTKPFKYNELEARVTAQLRAQAVERTLDERESRLVAIGQMTSTISHDLRSPLQTIMGQVGMLRLFSSQNEELARLENNLVAVESAAGRAKNMLDELMEFASGNEVKLDLALHSMASFVDEIRRDLHDPLKDQGIEFVLERPDPCLLEAEVDAFRLRRIVENLINNSRDALLGLETDCNGRRIFLQLSSDQNKILVRVADNGPGIPDEIRETLFKPFATAGKPQGTGLGLSIVRNLIRAHGGKVDVDFEPEEGGAAFALQLPLPGQKQLTEINQPGAES